MYTSSLALTSQHCLLYSLCTSPASPVLWQSFKPINKLLRMNRVLSVLAAPHLSSESVCQASFPALQLGRYSLPVQFVTLRTLQNQTHMLHHDGEQKEYEPHPI